MQFGADTGWHQRPQENLKVKDKGNAQREKGILKI